MSQFVPLGALERVDPNRRNQEPSLWMIGLLFRLNVDALPRLDQPVLVQIPYKLWSVSSFLRSIGNQSRLGVRGISSSDQFMTVTVYVFCIYIRIRIHLSLFHDHDHL